jgi:hypothetical protein
VSLAVKKVSDPILLNFSRSTKKEEPLGSSFKINVYYLLASKGSRNRV